MGICRSRKFIRDDQTAVEIDFTYRITSSSAIEVTEWKAWRWEDRNDPSAPYVALKTKEYERFEEELALDPDTWDVD